MDRNIHRRHKRGEVDVPVTTRHGHPPFLVHVRFGPHAPAAPTPAVAAVFAIAPSPERRGASECLLFHASRAWAGLNFPLAASACQEAADNLKEGGREGGREGRREATRRGQPVKPHEETRSIVRSETKASVSHLLLGSELQKIYTKKTQAVLLCVEGAREAGPLAKKKNSRHKSPRSFLSRRKKRGRGMREKEEKKEKTRYFCWIPTVWYRGNRNIGRRNEAPVVQQRGGASGKPVREKSRWRSRQRLP